MYILSGDSLSWQAPGFSSSFSQILGAIPISWRQLFQQSDSQKEEHKTFFRVASYIPARMSAYRVLTHGMRELGISLNSCYSNYSALLDYAFAYLCQWKRKSYEKDNSSIFIFCIKLGFNQRGCCILSLNLD